MLRSLTIRLNPETVSWAASFGLLEVGIASCLVYFGVGGGLTLAWALLAAGVFATCEPGLFAWLWVVMVAPEEEEPRPEKSAAERTPDSTEPVRGESGGAEAKDPGPSFKADAHDTRLIYEERVGKLIESRSSNMSRALVVFAAIALACLAFLGSKWMPNGIPPPSQAALVDQLRSDLKNCQERSCGDNSRGDGFGDEATPLDPKFKQDLLDAVKDALKPSDTFWTSSSILGVSALVLLLIALAVAVVLMIRKRPETAAPLGTLGLAATAIKEAEHLSRLDTTSYRIAEFAFAALLFLFAWLAWKKLNAPAPGVILPQDAREDGKSKVESPLSLLFSALVLLWALLAICYRYQGMTVQPVPAPAHEKVTLGFRLLPSVPGFVSGKTDQLKSGKSPDEVAREIVQEAHDKGAQPDDLLLLLGSADCTAVRKPDELSNQTLANKRAEGLAGIIDSMKVFAVNHVNSRSLHQGERCTGSDDLRAVFPVLIKLEKSNATVQ
jgi:hypothetical protein